MTVMVNSCFLGLFKRSLIMASQKIIAFSVIFVVIAAENVPINHYNVQIQPCPPNLKENSNIMNKVDNFFENSYFDKDIQNFVNVLENKLSIQNFSQIKNALNSLVRINYLFKR